MLSNLKKKKFFFNTLQILNFYTINDKNPYMDKDYSQKCDTLPLVFPPKLLKNPPATRQSPAGSRPGHI